MYLKRLEMRGFKTFADKTTIEFHPGLSAIVGPNGVGKSNITDAILWVLGEQSPRALRTESLQDVIFAGSEKRRPLNMAEVHLTLDNSDGSLPTEYAEVVISRRVFRDGESEYLLNNTVCRLKDIRDLLMDTGLGPKAYSVVGQGEIDAILSVRGEDRRELLEEVAGVRKYRVRRAEAERKLEATEINLTRVADILQELKSQREPLEQEAERARRYKTLDEKLRQLELFLLAADYRRHEEKRGQLAHEAAIASADLQATRNLLSALEAEEEKLQVLVLGLEQELERLRLEALRLQREAAEAREQRAVSAERQRTLGSRRQTLEETLAQQQQREAQLTQQHEALQAECAALADRLRSEKTRLQEQEREYEQRLAAARAQQAVAQRLEAERVRLLQQIARLENEAAALSSLQADLEERIRRLEGQRAALQERRQSLEAQAAAARTTLQELRERLQAARAHEQELVEEVSFVQGVLRDHLQKRSLLAEGISGLESRRRVLEELRASLEGVQDGARHVLQAAAAGQLTGIRGLLAEALDVPEKYVRAIEAALGERLHWVLCQTREDALRAIAFLRERGLGRATFLPLAMPTPMRREPLPLSGMRRGCLGLASRLIGVERQAAPALEPLLSQIVVCSDLEAARETFERLPGRCLVVTLAGELLWPEGGITGGEIEGGSESRFSRERELEALASRLAEWRQCLGRMYRAEEQLEEELRKRQQAAAAAAEEAQRLRSELLQREAEFEHQQAQLRAAAEAIEEMAQEIARLQQRLVEATERQQETLEQAESARQAIERLEGEIAQAQQQAGTAQEREALRQALTERQVLVAELRQQLSARETLRQHIAAEAEQLQRARETTAAELNQISHELAQIEKFLAATGDEAEKLARATALEAEAEEKAAELMGLRDQLAETQAKRRELNQAAEQQTERLHVAELALTRAEAALQAIAERLQDVYQTSIEQALGMTMEGMTENQARREAAQLRAEMRNLGPVHLGAIEECERLRAREAFLESQQNDLLAAKADLLQVIAELDEAAKSTFMETLARVAEEFDVIFKRLFEGGHTQLTLSDPEDPLNAGVEVIVTPPGKKQQNLLTLSGGERALTALALLFALLRVKPPPFCVMDEIDAALDASNTDRFAELLREFAQRSQFIIITHNPRTMEKADVLHGVTMQEPGVSKLISVELEQAQREAEQRAAAG